MTDARVALLVEQFQDAVDDVFSVSVSRMAQGRQFQECWHSGFLRRNRLSCGLLFIVLTSQLKLWELELFLPQQLLPSLPPHF